MPYMCALCGEGEAATVLLTPLTGGDTMPIGPDCMVTGLCGLLSVATGTDPGKLYDALTELAGKVGQDEDQPAAKTRRRRPAAAATVPPGDSQDGPDSAA